MSAMEKFNPQTVAEALKEKIRLEVVNLIPIEQLTKLIEEETSKIINGRAEDSQSLRYMIVREVRSKCAEMVKAEFDKPEWQGQWGTCGQKIASEAVAKILKENMADVFVSLVGSISTEVAGVVQSRMADQIRNIRGY